MDVEPTFVAGIKGGEAMTVRSAASVWGSGRGREASTAGSENPRHSRWIGTGNEESHQQRKRGPMRCVLFLLLMIATISTTSIAGQTNSATADEPEIAGPGEASSEEKAPMNLATKT